MLPLTYAGQGNKQILSQMTAIAPQAMSNSGDFLSHEVTRQEFVTAGER
jgi:hypothetical protein